MCIPRSWAPNLRWFRPGVPFGRMDRLEDLKRRGWVAPSLAFFDGLDMEKVKEILGPICSEWGLEDFAALREEAGRQKRMVDADNVSASREQSSSHRDVTWQPGEGHRDLKSRMIWPTRFYRRLRHCKDEGQRQKLEEDERDRQIGKLVALLKKIGLIEDGDDRPAGPSGAWAVKRHALGRRANTLRIHVRLGERMREYAMRTHGVEWFRNVAEIMDYVAGRLEEPCGKTVPNSIYSAIKFLELSAELPVQRRMGSDQALENFINEVNRSQFWAAKPRISASRWPLSIVICWEFVVMDRTQHNYIRLYTHGSSSSNYGECFAGVILLESRRWSSQLKKRSPRTPWGLSSCPLWGGARGGPSM